MTIAAYKSLIDTTVTNQTAYKSISPADLGNLLKIGADLSIVPDPIEIVLDGTGVYTNALLIGSRLIAVTVRGAGITTQVTGDTPTPAVTLNASAGTITFHISTTTGWACAIYYSKQL